MTDPGAVCCPCLNNNYCLSCGPHKLHRAPRGPANNRQHVLHRASRVAISGALTIGGHAQINRK